MSKLLAILMLVAPFAAVPASADMICEPVGQYVCTGDSGDDEWAECDGLWADMYGEFNLYYVQVCSEHDGDATHVFFCTFRDSYDAGSSACDEISA